MQPDHVNVPSHSHLNEAVLQAMKEILNENTTENLVIGEEKNQSDSSDMYHNDNNNNDKQYKKKSNNDQQRKSIIKSNVDDELEINNMNDSEYKEIIEMLKECDTKEWNKYFENFKRAKMNDKRLKWVDMDDNEAWKTIDS